ncbi:zinc dependent phospholipase C family protein [Cohnella faecalis]|uniref:Phospholipase C/D domain-containing protein n=1 Tax=Cohnella faecalis TaxID=2315694 RepID=A0A398CQ07_9BACL|nr:zinc dependent phospholipase C family protein [Cohnella faecalis]RIE02838.1 hypothetical protein D3H35_19605 [Cohnella faecalis]
MPSIWAHIQFGRELLDDVGESGNMKKSDWKRAFQLGCQGPDFLFFHHFWPWQSTTLVNRLGTLMHNTDCGPFLLSLFDSARSRREEDPASAYVLGFLLHHILDRHLHPFVFSRSGFRKWRHNRYETIMDSAIMHLRSGIHTGSVPVAPEVDTNGLLPGEGFAEQFLRISALHYPAIASRIDVKQLNEAVADTIKAQRLFFDPAGWKGTVLAGQLAPFSPPRRIPDWDVLNVRRERWIDPCDRTVFHQESAMELWELALADGRATTGAALAYLRANASEAAETREAFAALLGNLSYETGRSCGTAWIRFADSVLPE